MYVLRNLGRRVLQVVSRAMDSARETLSLVGAYLLLLLGKAERTVLRSFSDAGTLGLDVANRILCHI